MSRLFERERELGVGGELLEVARAGSGRVLLVLGPAGIGKTGLLAATSYGPRGGVWCERGGWG
jgi:predicted ATPase